MTAPTSQPSPLPWTIEAAKELFPGRSAAMTSDPRPEVRHSSETEIRHVAEIIARHAPTDSREKRLEAALMEAQEAINWMLNNRQFLGANVFDYIEAALRPGE